MLEKLFLSAPLEIAHFTPFAYASGYLILVIISSHDGHILGKLYSFASVIFRAYAYNHNLAKPAQYMRPGYDIRRHLDLQ